MKKFIGQEIVDLYANACDFCGEITHQSRVALKVEHQSKTLLFCYACAPNLLERIKDLSTYQGGTIRSVLEYNAHPV